MKKLYSEKTPTDMNEVIGTHDILWITLDTLRYDVAQELYLSGKTPNIASLLSWEKRHSPGTFTYAAHHAFFAGFLPTPAHPGKHERLVATQFAGSLTTLSNTWTTTRETIVQGLAEVGYKTLCIGGTGFFNQETALSRVFPSFFQKSIWNPQIGVTDPRSFENQIAELDNHLDRKASLRFTFINVSAIHQPNYFYLPESEDKIDSLESHRAALMYIDRHWLKLMRFAQVDRPIWVLVCSDHGTTYGEDGFSGHRLAHPLVTTVPFAHFVLRSP